MKKVVSILLAVVFCFMCGISVFAEVSPTPDIYYTIATNVAVVGSGVASAAPSVGKAGQIVVLTAVAADGYIFDHWEIDGKFEIVEGTIYDPEIKVEIVPDADNKTHGDLEDIADIVGQAHFKPIGGEEETTGEQVTAKPDNNPSSPNTGSFSTQAATAVLFSVLALVAVVFIYKKRTVKTK